MANGLELGHEVAVARGAGLVRLGIDGRLGLGRVVRRRLAAAAHRVLRRAHETFHCFIW